MYRFDEVDSQRPGFFQKMIIIVFGLPGSGKSFFAIRLANLLDATYISSDRVRKEIFAQPTYSQEEKLAVYREMLQRMKKAGGEKRSVVLDATFHATDIRKKFAEKAQQPGDTFFVEVWAEEAVVKERLQKNRKDSDADFEIYKKIKTKWKPMTEHHLILESTDNNIEEMLQRTADYLHLR